MREVDGFCFDETQRNGSTFATDLGVIVADEMLGVRILLGGCSGVFKKEDIERTCHAHPTHTEAIKEAALAVDKRPIHF